MFKGSILAGDLKEALSAIEVLVDEAILRITRDEWKVKAVDPANIAMVDWHLNRSAFASYEGDQAGEFSDKYEAIAGLSLEVWSEILEMAESNELVEIFYHGGKFYISIDGLSYIVRPPDLEKIRKEPKTEIPNLEYPVQVTVDARRFVRAVKAAVKFTDVMAIGTENQVIYYESKIDDRDVSVERIRAEVPIPTPEKIPTVRSLFALEYLFDIAKIIPKNTLIMLLLNKDYPAKIRFTIGKKCQVEYMIAPRIDSG